MALGFPTLIHRLPGSKQLAFGTGLVGGVLVFVALGGRLRTASSASVALPPATPPMAAEAVAAALNGPKPMSFATQVDPLQGGTILAGNVGLVIPPEALQGVAGPATVLVTSQPSLADVDQGGPARFSPNGTVVDVDVRDAANQRFLEFSSDVTLVCRPNGADFAMADSDFSRLTLAYVSDDARVLLFPSAQMNVDRSDQTIYARMRRTGRLLVVSTARDSS